MLVLIWSKHDTHRWLERWKIVQSIWNIVWLFLVKLIIHFPYNPAILLLFNLREIKTYTHTKIHTKLFTAILFVIVKNQKHFKYQSISKWKNKLWGYSYNRVYQAITRDKWLIHATTWIRFLKSPNCHIYIHKHTHTHIYTYICMIIYIISQVCTESNTRKWYLNLFTYIRYFSII